MRLVTVLVALLAFVPVAPASPQAAPFALSECAYSEIAVKVDPARVAPFVPDDFVVKVFADGTATVIHGAVRCASAASGESRGSATFAYTSVKLERPTDAALAGADDVSVYLWRIEHWGGDDLYAQLTRASGALDLRAARIAPDVETVGGSSLVVAVEGTHRVDAGPSPPLAAQRVGAAPLHWREFGAAEGGYAILDAGLFPDDAAGASLAVIAPAPGSLTHAAVGDWNAGLLTYGRAYDIVDGTLTFAPRA